MAAAYSMDLRERVHQGCGRGSLLEGARGAVSRECAVGQCAQTAPAGNWVVGPAPADEISRVGCSKAQRGWLACAGDRTARCDARRATRGLRTTAALTTIWRELNQLDFTVKKNGTRRRTAAALTSRRSAAGGASGCPSAMSASTCFSMNAA